MDIVREGENIGNLNGNQNFLLLLQLFQKVFFQQF